MTEQSHARRLNIVAPGQQNRSHVALDNERLEVGESTSEQTINYSNYAVPGREGEDHVLSTSTPCPCAGFAV